MLCVLHLSRSQEIDWSHYGGENSSISEYEFTDRQLHDVPPLCASEMSKTGSGIVVDVLGYEARWPRDIQLASTLNCKAEWFELVNALGSGRSTELVVVGRQVLYDLKLLFERNDRWTKDVGSVKLEVQKERGSLSEELPGLQMAASTDSLGIVKFDREVIKKSKSLVGEVEALEKTVSGNKIVWKGVEKKLTECKCSVSASDASAVKLAELEELLVTVREELASFKEQLRRVDTEKADSDKPVAEVSKEL